jgi:hypothetical protein
MHNLLFYFPKATHGYNASRVAKINDTEMAKINPFSGVDYKIF